MLPIEFFTAGQAVFTVSNPKKEHYTFRIDAVNDLPHQPLFLHLLVSGSDNFQYIGMVDRETGYVKTTKASKITEEATSFKVADWALRHAWAGKELPEGYKLQHEGKCGKCGRRLTHPTSLETGLGPECAKSN